MYYSGITAPDIANGTGCRVVLWVSGCNHHCIGCHNKETWNYKHGILFNNDARTILDKWLQKSYISGLTLSGGDPLDRNEEELLEILDLCKSIKYKYPNKNIWIYTGYTFESLKGTQLEILKYCDVLVDGPYIESLRDLSLPFRGSTNQRIINLRDVNDK